MMNIAFLSLLLFAFLLDSAKKCDPYFVGSVWVRRTGHGVDDESAAVSYQGCKKGCFYNETFNEDGARMCEKCSAIEDENTCKGHEATCKWQKNGKCRSTSCPQIAKNRNTVETPQNDFVDDNSVNRTARYQLQIRLEKECIEGSSLEKYHNQVYLDHYKKFWNYRYSSGQVYNLPCGYTATPLPPVNNCDKCTVDPPNSHKCTTSECATLNDSLSIAATNHVCDDRLYPNLAGTNQDSTCRTLPDTYRQICYFEYDQAQSIPYVYQDSTKSSYRPGTQYEYCIQDLNEEKDKECTRDALGQCTVDTACGQIIYPALTPDNRRKIYGYSTVAEICNHYRSLKHKDCEDGYTARIKFCHSDYVTDEIQPGDLVRLRVDVKASRAACHHLYHCMYSRINNRCSYWSIWAFILTLVLVVVVVVGAGVAVAVLFLVRK